MGRTEKSQGLAPPAMRKDMRAKQARHIVNRVVPAILASNARAKRGVDGSRLFVDPGPVGVEQEKITEKEADDTYVKRKGQGRRKVKDAVVDESLEVGGRVRGGKKVRGGRKDSLEDFSKMKLTPDSPAEVKSSAKHDPKTQRVRIVTTDSLTAAHMLTFPWKYPTPASSRDTTSPTSPQQRKKDKHNVCILNMASPLRPGGGVLSGATSQEEFLCARTTLLPSLKDSFYRLPEYGGIYTHDVLVFRNSGPLSDNGGELGLAERYWIDVVSAGMLRFPELEGDEGEGKRLGKKDREATEKKMRSVLRILASEGVSKVVLGAWGCGAYGNPVRDVAKAWRTVLDGVQQTGNNKKNKRKGNEETETWDQLDEIMFAISNAKMATDFAAAFGEGIEVEKGPGGDPEENEEEEEDIVAQELRTKIQEMDGQIAQVWNPDLRVRMSAILEGLRAQLAQIESSSEVESAGSETADSNHSQGSHNGEVLEADGSVSEESGEDDKDDQEETEGRL